MENRGCLSKGVACPHTSCEDVGPVLPDLLVFHENEEICFNAISLGFECNLIECENWNAIWKTKIVILFTEENLIYWLNSRRNCQFVTSLKNESIVAQSCPTLFNPMDCRPPGSSVHGILQARVLEWVVMPFSRGSSWPRDQTWVSCIADRSFTLWAFLMDLKELLTEAICHLVWTWIVLILSATNSPVCHPFHILIKDMEAT